MCHFLSLFTKELQRVSSRKSNKLKKFVYHTLAMR